MARRPRPADDLDDEPAPWLEPRARAAGAPRVQAVDEPRQTVITWRALIIGGAIAFVLAVGLVIAVRQMIVGEDREAAEGEEAGLIRAPAEPYKTRPDPVAAPALEGEGQTIFDTAGGEDTQGQIDPNALPEEPARPSAAPRDLLPDDGAPPDDGPLPAPVPQESAMPLPMPASPAMPPRPTAPPIAAAPSRSTAPAPAVRAVNPPKPARAVPVAPPPSGAATDKFAATRGLARAGMPEEVAPRAPAEPVSSGRVQLGAFSSEEKAEAVRARLAARYPEIRAMTIAPVERDGRTLWRLRGAGDAAAICAKLTAAGESCIAAR